jgi:UDP-glucose 4-epimerase
VHGDGLQTRAFTYIDDVVAANMAASTADSECCRGQAYNIAGTESWSLLDLLERLGGILEVEPQPIHTDPRAGDVRQSGADISAAEKAFQYRPRVGFEEGLRRTVEWFSERAGPHGRKTAQ